MPNLLQRPPQRLALLIATACATLLALPPLATAAPATAIAAPVGLPSGSLVVEMQLVAASRPRALALWMLNPEKNPSSWVEDPEYDYTCPEYTRGSHYRGATRVSLIDATSGSIINTVEVKDEDLKGEDSFDVPYAIKKGYAYKVEGAPKRGAEAKPILLALEDYNRDGKAHEFVLAVAQACMGLNTTLIGYSARQDKVVQYPIELELEEDGKTTKETSLWFDYLFSYEMPGASVYKSEKAPKGGRWKFENDYRGRGGALYEYDLRYDKENEIFTGTVRRTRADLQND